MSNRIFTKEEFKAYLTETIRLAYAALDTGHTSIDSYRASLGTLRDHDKTCISCGSGVQPCCGH
jgi:hypothetical protein